MAEKKTLSGSSFLSDKSKGETIQSPDFVSLYSNNVQMSISVFDFVLAFGEMTGEAKNGQIVVNQKARVILSKEMAKVLQALLNFNIKTYEDNFGEITLPNMAIAAQEVKGKT